MKKALIKTLSFIFILALLSSSLHAQQTTTVIRVVDGDTLKVRYWGKEESIRLIGIDTPESRVNKKTKRDAKRSGQDVETIIALGKRATEYVESLVKPGDGITIKLDVQELDRYGTLLGYVTVYATYREEDGALVSLTDAEEELPDGVGFPIYDNPKIELDSGRIVYGCQVWWRPEEEMPGSVSDESIE